MRFTLFQNDIVGEEIMTDRFREEYPRVLSTAEEDQTKTNGAHCTPIVSTATAALRGVDKIEVRVYCP